MELAYIDWILIFAFLLLSLGIGLYFKNRSEGNLTDFFLGGRKLPWYIAGISMVATTFAADTPLAVTELVVKNGISGNWLWWSFLTGGMLTTFFFAKLWRKANVLTEVELIEKRYSGKPAAVLRGFKAVYLGLFMNVMIIGRVNLALISILEVFFGIPGSDVIWYVFGAMALAAIYSSLSGLWGVAITDTVQFVIAMVGTVILSYKVITHDKIGGISGLQEKLPEWAFDFFPSISSGSDMLGGLTSGVGAFLAYTTVQWWASWYPGSEPGGGGYVAQRMMSTKSEKDAVYATLFFQIGHYCLRPWPWILVALATIVLYPGLEDPKIGYVMAMRDFLPDGLRGLLLVAFLAAYMSTISTQLNWGAGYLVNDFYKRFSRPNESDKHYVSMSRLVTILLVIVGGIATTFMTSISGVWQFIMECGAGLGLVLILRWYWWRINAWSEIVATITPFVIYTFLQLFAPEMVFPNSFFLIVGGTTLSWIVATIVTKPTDSHVLKAFYETVQPEGAWKPIQKISSVEFKASGIWRLVICWLSGIVFTYSILFSTGYVIFGNWDSFMIWFPLAVISLFILIITLRKTSILD